MHIMSQDGGTIFHLEGNCRIDLDGRVIKASRGLKNPSYYSSDAEIIDIGCYETEEEAKHMYGQLWAAIKEGRNYIAM